VLRPSIAFALMGFGLAFVMQVHLSASLLGLMAVFVFVMAARESIATALAGVCACLAGAALPALALWPTVRHDGWAAVTHAYWTNAAFDPRGLADAPEIVARFFSFASFEIARFLGAGTDTRLLFLRQFPWAAPFVVAAALVGFVQVASLIAGLVVTRRAEPGWRAVRLAAIVTVVLLCASFLLSVKGPASHTFYATMPIAMIYACTFWAPFFSRKIVRTMAIALLVCGAVTHVALAWRNLHLRSLYTDRALVMRALDAHDYRIVGERRPSPDPAR
jgi:hypothetical protein